MKGFITTSLMAISFVTVVPAVHASEGAVETASRWSQAKELCAAWSSAAFNWTKTTVPAVFNAASAVAQEGYTFATGYAKENPGKTAAIVAASIVVPTAVYFAAKKAINYFRK